MAKKYQVFISSTFDDLKEHRDAVVKAVLQLGHLPVGMEMFNAGDQTQWETIKSYIDSSDYYIVILAHRYGSKDPASGLSYTETEYDYAGEQGVPRLGFVIDKTATWPADQFEAKAKKKLDDFKKKVGKARVIKFWDTIDKLAYHVSLSLGNEITINPRVGWVRATEAASPQVAEELARLSKDNKELTDQLQKLQNPSEAESLENILSENVFQTEIEAINSSLLDIFRSVCERIPNATTLKVMDDIASANNYANTSWQNLNRRIGDAIQELERLGLVKYDGSDTEYRFIGSNERTVSTKTWALTEKGTQLYKIIKYSR